MKGFFRLLVVAGLLFTVGTVGALECETIGVGQFWLQSAAGIAAMWVGAHFGGLFYAGGDEY